MAEVVRAELRGLGAEVHEDGAAAALPAGCGNIVARFAPTAEGGVPIMFGAHLDTVPVTGADRGGAGRRPPHQPPRRDPRAATTSRPSRWCSRRCAGWSPRGAPTPGVELVFTPCEEIGLRGAARLRPARRCAARFGFVYDHTGPAGRRRRRRRPRCTASSATFVGRAAHAGITPESGRSAILAAARAIARMPLGRIDAETTANIGTVEGGTATNVVAERCTLTAEARSRDERSLSVQLTAMLDAMTWAASECEVDLETRVEKEFTAYRAGRGRPAGARWPWPCSSALGHTPRLVPSGGGSDVNAFIRNGFPAVNLCNGMIDVHTPDERIAVASLEQMLDVTLGLIDAARAPRDRRRRRPRPADPHRARSTRARSSTSARSDYRRPDGTIVHREVMDHPGAVVMVPVEDDHVLMVRQPREAVRGVHAGAAGREARPPGRGPAGLRPARAGRGGRPRGGDLARPRRLLHRARRSSPSSSTASWRPTCRPVEGAARPTRTRRSRSSPWPLADLEAA